MPSAIPRAHRARTRRIASVLAALALAIATPAGLPGGIGRAAASTLDAQCLGTFVRTFTPPVTTSTQNVTVVSTDSYSTCVAGPTGTGLTTTTLPLSCVNVTAGPAETETITWNDVDGDTSTIAWGQPVVAGQTVVFTGAVTGGLYHGATATKITSGISYVGSVTPCLLLGTPIAQTTGLIDSLTITG